MPHSQLSAEDIEAAKDLSIQVSAEVYAQAVADVGLFFEPLNKIDRHKIADDHLDSGKSTTRAHLLQRYSKLRDQKVLEIGSGFGTNLAVWIKDFDVDGYGVEPASLGFEMSFRAAKQLFEDNGLNSNRIIDASGEKLPFEDGTFDIVYSANVLEHTSDPLKVLLEATRVLKPGGIIHMEIPNYLSYFEGHYMIPMPPVWSNRILALWVKLFRRNSAFVSTLKLINPLWCKRAIRKVNMTYPVQLITLGEDIFFEKLSVPYKFETKVVAGKLETIIRGIQRINFGNWIGRIIVALQGHYPIYMTVRKL
jgi:SAM-dependent methyltransferase